jgi:hypothetical protein
MAITDIFFSYSSKDRDRVRAVRDALASQGFEIFWDQSVPPGLDWDTWIRQHLNEAKCALVFWSTSSVGSDNVRHEATVAKQQGKLIPVLLDPLTVEQFPMGLYSTQGADLTTWTGGEQEQSWSTLKQQVEFKLTPLWVRRLIDGMEAELVAERARREGAERRDKTLRDQIIKEAQAQQELRHERDQANEELSTIKARLEEAQRGKADLQRRITEQSQRIADLESERQRATQAPEAAPRQIKPPEQTTDNSAGGRVPPRPTVATARAKPDAIKQAPNPGLGKPVERNFPESSVALSPKTNQFGPWIIAPLIFVIFIVLLVLSLSFSR